MRNRRPKKYIKKVNKTIDIIITFDYVQLHKDFNIYLNAVISQCDWNDLYHLDMQSIITRFFKKYIDEAAYKLKKFHGTIKSVSTPRPYIIATVPENIRIMDIADALGFDYIVNKIVPEETVKSDKRKK